MAIFNPEAVDLVRGEMRPVDEEYLSLLTSELPAKRVEDELTILSRLPERRGGLPLRRKARRVVTAGVDMDFYVAIWRAMRYARTLEEAMSLFCMYQVEVAPREYRWVKFFPPLGLPIRAVRLPTASDFRAFFSALVWFDGIATRREAVRWTEKEDEWGRGGPSSWGRDQGRATRKLLDYLQKSGVTSFKFITLAFALRLEKEDIEVAIAEKKLRDTGLNWLVDADQMYRRRPPILPEMPFYEPPPELGFSRYVNGATFTEANWARTADLVGKKYPKWLFMPPWFEQVGYESLLDIGTRQEPGDAARFIGRYLAPLDIVQWDEERKIWVYRQKFTIMLRELRREIVGRAYRNIVARELAKTHRRNFYSTYREVAVDPALWVKAWEQIDPKAYEPLHMRGGVGTFEEWVAREDHFITPQPHDPNRPREELVAVHRDVVFSGLGWAELFDEATWPGNLSDEEKKRRRTLRLLVRALPVRGVTENGQAAQVDWGALPGAWVEAPAGGWARLPPDWATPPNWTGLPPGYPGLPPGWVNRAAFATEEEYQEALEPFKEAFLYGEDGLLRDWKVFCVYDRQVVHPELMLRQGQLALWVLYLQNTSLMTPAAEVEKVLESPAGRTLTMAASGVIQLVTAGVVPLILLMIGSLYLGPYLKGIWAVLAFVLAVVFWALSAYIIRSRLTAMSSLH